MSLSQVRAGTFRGERRFSGCISSAVQVDNRRACRCAAGQQQTEQGQDTWDAVKQHAARMTRIAILIEAIKEQQAEMQTAAQRIADLQQEWNRELALSAPAALTRRRQRQEGERAGRSNAARASATRGSSIRRCTQPSGRSRAVWPIYVDRLST